MADPLLDGIVKGMVQQRATASIYAGSTANPGIAAQANELGRKLKLDPALVEAALPEMAAEEKRRKREEQARQNAAYARIMSANPRLAASGADDDHLPKVAQKVDDHVSWLSPKFVGQAATSLIGSVPSFFSGIAHSIRGVGEASAEARKARSGLGVFDKIPDPLEVLAPLGRWLAQAPDAGVEATTVRNSDPYQNAFLSGFQSAGSSMGALAISLVTKSPSAGAVTLGAQTGGQSYKAGREEGLNARQALGYAAGDAAIETGTELIPMGWLTKSIQEGKGILKTIGGDFLREMPTELIATAGQEFNRWVNVERPKGVPFEQYLKELPDELRDTVIATAVTVGLVGSGGYVAGRHIQRKMDERAAIRVGKVMEAAAQSSTRTSNPSDFEEALNQLVQDTPAEHLYVPAEQVDALFKDDPAKLAEDPFWSQYQQQLDQARALGGDVIIPLAGAATHLAGTPQWEALKEHVRVSAKGASITEAKDKAKPEELEKLANEIGAMVSGAVPRLQQAQALQAVKGWSQTIVNRGSQAEVVDRYVAHGMLVAYRDEAALAASKGEAAPSIAEFAKGWLPQVQRMAQAEYEKNGSTAPTMGQGQTTEYVRTVEPLAGLGETSRQEVYHVRPARADDIRNLTGGTDTDFRAGNIVTRTIRVDGKDRSAEFLGKDGNFYPLAELAKIGGARYFKTDDEALAALKGDHNVEVTAQDAGGNQAATGPVRDRRGLSGSPELLAAAARQELGLDEPLPGAPQSLTLPGRGKVPVGRHRHAVQAAASYMASANLHYGPPLAYAKLSEERATRIAAEFEAMEHAPDDPQVKAAYDAMIAETLAQWQAIKETGLEVEFIEDGMEDPYAASPRMAIMDVIENNHLWVFPTTGGFGQGEVSDSPMLQPTDEYVNGRQLLANDVFRIVHDYFGHIKDGHGFRAEGEENAWQSHAAMYTPLARRAMTTETRGQNSWLNYGPHGQTNRSASSDATVFAPQKVGLMPEWTSEEGMLAAPNSGHKRVFHGTPFEFDSFADNGRAVWFAERPQLAGQYASARRVRKISGDRIIPATIQFENPLNLDPYMPANGYVEDPVAWAKDIGLDLEAHGWQGIGGYRASDVFRTQAFANAARAAGFDALEVTEQQGKTWGVLGKGAVTSTITGQTLNQTVDPPGFARVAPFLTEDEKKGMRLQSKEKLLSILDDLPDPEEVAAVAVAGRAKKGWYARSAQAIVDVFGLNDAPRFAALLAALSPQVSVQANLYNALKIWTNWNDAGRPTDRKAIVEIMGQSVMGKKGSGSVLNAWINNTVIALSAADAQAIELSGPKVNSFFANLAGVVDEVTNDTWMARYAGLEARLHGPTKKTNLYKAMSAVVRQAAAVATERTGQSWEPMEVQETVWSFAKTLYEMAQSDPDGRLTTELLDAAELTHADIADTVDFATLFSDGIFRLILEEGGYGEQVAGLDSSGRAAQFDGSAEPVTAAEGTGFAQPDFERFLKQAAARFGRELELRRAKQDNRQGELVLNQSASPSEEVFYSNAERAVEQAKMEKASADQWIALLTPGRTPGIKAEEIEWTGVIDWLKVQKGAVTKDALLQLLRDRGIKVEEQVLGNPESVYNFGTTDEGKYGVYDGTGKLIADFDTPEEADDYASELRVNSEGQEAQFKNWSSDPSNETYRELLITLPLGQGSNPERAPSTHWDTDGVVAHVRFMEKMDAEGKRVLFIEEVQSDWHQKGRDQGYAEGASEDQIKDARELRDIADRAVTRAAYALLEKAPAALEQWREVVTGFKRPAPEEGKLVNEGFDPDGLSETGKLRMETYLNITKRINEFRFQTDAGFVLDDQARDIAYDAARFLRNIGFDGLVREETEALNRTTLRLNEADQEVSNLVQGKGIPEAPFKTSWPALVMKRVIRYAVDNGFDKVAWTTGEDQTKRYWGDLAPSQERFVEVTQPPRVREELFEVFGPELASVLPLEVVDAAMLPALQNDEVRKAVVEAISVDVVDILARNKLTPEQLASDPNMVGNALPVVDRAPVARGLADALQFVGTGLRAALNRVPSFETAGGDGKLFSAIRASDLDPRVIVRLLTTPPLGQGATDTGKGGAGSGAETSALARIGSEDRAAELAVALNWHGRLVANRTGVARQDLYEPNPGEGMKAFYDRNLVNITNDIIKKYGAKVHPIPVKGMGGTDEAIENAKSEWRSTFTAARAALGPPQSASHMWSTAEIDQRLERLSDENISAEIKKEEDAIAANEQSLKAGPEDWVEDKAGWIASIEGMTAKRRERLAALQAALAGEGSLAERRNELIEWRGKLEEAERLMNTKPNIPGSNFGFDITPQLAEAAGSGFALFQEKRGNISIRPGQDGLMQGALIRAFEASNFSTAIHELGHFFLEDLKRRALRSGGSEQARADWEEFKRWAGQLGLEVKDNAPVPVEAHEYFARGMERFAWEGNAPSRGLRAIFTRMREFMLELYKTASQFNAPITPEIRQVMGRLLAAQDEIDAQDKELAAARGEIKGLLSGAEQAAYDALGIEAKKDAEDKLYARILSALKTEKMAAYRDRREELRGQVAGEIDSQPVYRALKIIRAGIPGEDGNVIRARLPREWLVDNYGADIVDQLPRSVPPIVTDKAEDMIDPEVLAGMAGFGSSDEMIRRMLDLEAERQQMKAEGDTRSPRMRALDTEVGERLRDEIGDPLADLEEEAQAALQNDRQAELMSMELRALARQTGKKPTAWRMAVEWARQRVRIAAAKDATSGSAIQQYARNVAKAQKNAEEALTAGKFDEAFQFKQQQLLNAALLSEAKKARDEVDAAVRRMQKIAKRDTIPSVDQDYLEQAHALLEDVDLKDRSGKQVAKREAFAAWHAAQVARGIDPIVPASYREALGQTHWSKMGITELLELDKLVGQVIELGRLKQRLTDGKEQRDFAEAVEEMRESALNEKARKGSSTTDEARNFPARVRSVLRSADAAMLKVEQLCRWLDGNNDNGPWTRMIFNVMADAGGREQDLLRSYIGDINALIKALPKAIVRGWTRSVDTPELVIRNPEHIDAGQPFRGTKDQVVMMAMNWGNEGNRQRLVDGFGWQEAEVEAVLARLMTKEDWDFVQSVWDTVDKLWPEVEQLERRVNGVAPEKIEAVPVQTPHGVYRGGYFPVAYDPTQSTRSAIYEDDKLSPQGGLMQVVTRSSATKARSEAVKGRPILLSMSVITRHLGEVIHDVTHREAVSQVRRLLTEARIHSAINTRLGPEYAKAFGAWLENIATPNVAFSKDAPFLVQLGRHLNKGTSLVGLGFRFSTSLMQLLGLPSVVGEIGMKHMAHGIAVATAHPIKAYREIVARSAEMRSRWDTLDATIEDMVVQASGGKLQTIGPKGITKYAFHGILYMDLVVTTAAWTGAFDKALGEGMSEDEAVSYADRVIRTTQGSGSMKDRSRILNAHPIVRSFYPFFSYLNALYNMQRDIFRRVGHAEGAGDVAEAARRAWWVMIVPILLQSIIFGDGPDDEEDGAAWAEYLVKSVILGNLGSLPLIGNIANAIGNGYGYRSSAYQQIGEGLAKGYQQAADMVTDDKELTGATVKSTMTTAGVILAKPLGQLGATAQGVYDYARGEADPQDAGDWYELLTKGRISKQPTAAERLLGEK